MTITYHSGGRLQGIETDRTTKSLGVGDVGGWVEVGRTTLGSAGDNLDVTSLPNKRYYMTLASGLGSSNPNMDIQLNSDTGTNYSYRSSFNGGSDSANVGQPSMAVANNGAVATINIFGVSYFANIQAKEKLVHTRSVQQNSAGAGNAPARTEVASKWANTSNSISSINHVNLDSGHDFASGSEVVVLGWDPADTHTTNFWEELASVDVTSAASEISSGTITAKKYLWIQCYSTRTGANDMRFRFNNDTGSNYVNRKSSDGGADATLTSQTSNAYLTLSGARPSFLNMFVVNNSANEKLCIYHVVHNGTAGAGTAPQRQEWVGKWVNTSSQITEIDIQPDGGNITGNLRVWGSN